ncbi:prealbumin-like fold domain-containing protein [Streptomyces sp. NPDC051644]|uniref:prealbumin-like fold domain-containing protein n=1 Tax=Streptomyces sp. NPDC051644 TaxID=3365666 RepID=UPI00379C6325
MTLNTRRPVTGHALRRSTVFATAVLVGATALGAAPSAVAADKWGPGFAVPDDQNEPDASHLGAYGAPGAPVQGITGRAYCGDPTLAGPSAGGQFGKATEVTTWTSKATGRQVSKENVARAAYVLSKYGDTGSDVRAAAVDATLYTFLEQGSTYALPNGKRALERVSYPNVAKEVKTKAEGFITEAGALAGPYKVNVHTPAAFKPGEKTAITLDVTAASGQKVPGVKIDLNGAGAVAGAGTVTTNDQGTASATITPAKAGAVELKAVAKNLPASTLLAHLPANDKAQRMLVAGGSASAETRVKITVNALKGSIKVLKAAADTKKPLSGIEFEVKDENKKKVARGTTDAQGLWQVDNLPPGTYTVHEVKAAEGYQLAVDQNVNVVDGRASGVNIIDVKIPQPEKPKPRPVTIPELPKTGA